MGGRRHILHDVIRKSETVTLTVGDKSASKTVVLEEPIDIYLEIEPVIIPMSAAGMSFVTVWGFM